MDQILYQREMDPELLLNNLGFGGGINVDDSLARIPDRFLQNQLQRRHADLQDFLLNHPQYGSLFPGMSPSPVMGSSPFVQNGSQEYEDPDHTDMTDRTENQSPKVKGQCSDNLDLDQGYVQGQEIKDLKCSMSKFSENQKTTSEEPENNVLNHDTDLSSNIVHSSRLEQCGIIPERYLIKTCRAAEKKDASGVASPLMEDAATSGAEAVDNNTTEPFVTEHAKGGNIVVEAEVHAQHSCPDLQVLADNSAVSSHSVGEINHNSVDE